MQGSFLSLYCAVHNKRMIQVKALSKIDVPSLKSELIPEGFELIEGLNSIYELEFAMAEVRSLDREELLRRSAYFARIDGMETIHHKLCTDLHLLGSSASTRLRAFFGRFKYKTGYATHGLFPYRGKFHPQLIKGLLNVMRLKRGDIVLDPMTGSGTTGVEASIVGLDSIGIDANPFCVFMARTKADALNVEKGELEKFEDAGSLFDFFSKSSEAQAKLTDTSPFEYLKDEFSKNPHLRSIAMLCYLDSVAYSKRRKNKTPKDVFPTVHDRYMNVLRNFVKVRDENGLKLARVKIAEGDARDLSIIESGDLKRIDDDEIDGIITSPPYYFAIDYLNEDRSQLEYLGHNVDEIRERMIGLRGKDLKARIELFTKDMDSVFSEMNRVLRVGKYSTVIIGYNTVQMQREFKELGVDLREKMISLAKGNRLVLRKHIVRPIEGPRNIMQTEDIFIFQKDKSN